VRALVFAISIGLRTRFRDFGGARRRCGCQLHLALGAAYAPELNRRCRPHLKPTNKSYRIDETYIKVKGEDKYLCRAVDSMGQTIDFLLTAKRDAAAAKRFLRKALTAPGNPVPRVMNVDKNPAYPAAVEGLKAEGVLPRRVRLRQCGYRDSGHDSEGESEVAGQGRCRRPSALHCRAIRHRRITESIVRLFRPPLAPVATSQ